MGESGRITIPGVDGPVNLLCDIQSMLHVLPLMSHAVPMTYGCNYDNDIWGSNRRLIVNQFKDLIIFI